VKSISSDNIRQFLVDPRDARSFPITRCNGKQTIVEDIHFLLRLHCDALVVKVALVKASLKP